MKIQTGNFLSVLLLHINVVTVYAFQNLISSSHLMAKVCVNNSYHSSQWIFLKPCILIVDIMKMSMWIFNGAGNNFDRITAF